MRAQSQDYAKPSDLIRVSQAIAHISHNRGENPSPGPGGAVHSLFLGSSLLGLEFSSRPTGRHRCRRRELLGRQMSSFL